MANGPEKKSKQSIKPTARTAKFAWFMKTFSMIVCLCSFDWRLELYIYTMLIRIVLNHLIDQAQPLFTCIERECCCCGCCFSAVANTLLLMDHETECRQDLAKWWRTSSMYLFNKKKRGKCISFMSAEVPFVRAFCFRVRAMCLAYANICENRKLLSEKNTHSLIKIDMITSKCYYDRLPVTNGADGACV